MWNGSVSWVNPIAANMDDVVIIETVPEPWANLIREAIPKAESNTVSPPAEPAWPISAAKLSLIPASRSIAPNEPPAAVIKMTSAPLDSALSTPWLSVSREWPRYLATITSAITADSSSAMPGLPRIAVTSRTEIDSATVASASVAISISAAGAV